MGPVPEDGASRIETIRKDEQLVGSERFAVTSAWFESFLKDPNSAAVPKPASVNEKPENLVWLPLKAVELFEEWFGIGLSPTLSDWRKGTVAYIDDKGREEIEVEPTYGVVEIRTDESASEPLGKLEKVSAVEEIPLLVRKALDAVPSLVKVDEEDVRLWIRKSGESEFHLCSSDEAKEGASDPEDDLPEEFEEPNDTPLARAVPTLRTVLGPAPGPQQTLHFLLELRNADGKFPRRKVRPVKPIVTPRNTKGDDADFSETEKARPVSKSFSVTAAAQAGQNCDAQRSSDNRWLEAKIVEVQGQDVVVHFLSFPTKADETIPANSPRIQPPHTKVPNWRQQLKVGEELDVHYSSIAPRRGGRLYQTWREKSGTTAWVAGTARKIERNIPEPRVLVGVKFSRFSAESTVWVPLQSEKIAKRYTHSSPPKAETYGPQSSQGAPPMPGIVGLRNLGNTCYMNSMLQCLAHCDALKDHFVSGKYQRDLNRRNPLGMGGQLAEAFAEVITNMWSGEFQVVAPTKFKQILGQMNMQFQGFQQHDSQELLTLLADGLHEDLNRIEKKPATEPIESNGRPDEIVARESWDTFRKRNDSKIVDEMYGLLKSHLECPVCKKEAVKFDAYSNVSVPVPSLVSVKLKIVFINSKFEATRCLASVRKRAPGKAVAEWIANRFGIPDVDDVIVAEIFFNKAATYYHRTLVQGAESDTADPFEKTNVKDSRDTVLIVAWQLPSLQEIASSPRASTTSVAQFDANWSNFMKDIKELSLSAEQPQTVTKVKDLLANTFMAPTLCGPYPFAQRRLTQHLNALKNADFAQLVAREAVKLIEAEAKLNCPVEADLAKMCGEVSDALINSSANDTASVASDSASLTSNDKSIQKKVSSPFRVFSRLLNGSKENAPNSPAVPIRTTSPAAAVGNNTTASASANGTAPLGKGARLPIEIRHVRHKPGPKPNRQRCPVFLCLSADHTCDDLRRTIDDYIKSHCLAGFADPAQLERNKTTNDSSASVAAAAAGAAQLELNQYPENGVRNGVSKFSSSTSHASAAGKKSSGASTAPTVNPYYALELDVFEHTQLPSGPIPIIEALCLKASINALVVYVKWQDCAAAEYAYRASEQDEANADKDADAELGLGRVKMDPSCTEKEEQGGKVLTLQQCMDVFRKREQLGEDDPWYCDKCKMHRCAFKTMDLWDAPRILVIHLKRFLYERVGGVLGERVQREKINDLVQFPMENFDIGPLLAGKNHSQRPTVYDLFAVSNHMGGLGGGHYTAYVKADDGSWWLMNDGICTKVEKANEEAEVVSSSAYVLFYKRRD